MHQALYRKYRPTVFDDVSGQEHITSILKYEASKGSVSHAYLFAGSRGTGKTTCAKILAKVVNCLHPENGNPCNKCENCLAIDTGTTTDVIEMDAATNTGVDYIRDLRDNVMYTPAMLKKRVYIIDEAHMLSDSAFNALLKTIEEPPEHVLYIFATTEPHKIPATIISRCQRFEFRRINISNLVDRLIYIASKENIDLTRDGAALIAKTAQGGMRDAISLMELCAGSHRCIDIPLVNDILGTSPYDKMCSVAENIAKKNYSALFEAINDIVVSSKDILVFFSDLTSFYRDMMVQKSRNSSDFLDLLPAEYEMLEKVSSLFDMATLIYHSSLLDEAYTNMMRNPQNKRLCAEITLMKMCDPKLSSSADAILSRLSQLEDKVTLMSKSVSGDNKIPEQKEADGNTEEENSGASISPKATEEDEKPKDDKPSVNYQSDDFSKIENWEDFMAKVAEYDVAVESFLKNCSGFYSKKRNKYFIVSSNQLMASMLNTEKNKKILFNAMVCCNINISYVQQIEVIFRKINVKKDDLDEF